VASPARVPLLDFDPEAHVYRLDGVAVPSVTQVLRQTGYVTLEGVPEGVLEEARARGRRVHRALHFLLEGDLDLATVDVGDRGYLESAQAYLAQDVRRVAAIEQRVHSTRYGCAGTLDLLAVHVDGYPSIDDFKTGEPTDVAADLQTAAYQGFILEAIAAGDVAWWQVIGGGALPRVIRRRSIRLFADGRPGKPRVYTDHRDYARFLRALSVVHDQRARPTPPAWDDER